MQRELRLALAPSGAGRWSHTLRDVATNVVVRSEQDTFVLDLAQRRLLRRWDHQTYGSWGGSEPPP
jgi:hypothetical protein